MQTGDVRLHPADAGAATAGPQIEAGVAWRYQTSEHGRHQTGIEQISATAHQRDRPIGAATGVA
jgi:hypothetical protein